MTNESVPDKRKRERKRERETNEREYQIRERERERERKTKREREREIHIAKVVENQRGKTSRSCVNMGHCLHRDINLNRWRG